MALKEAKVITVTSVKGGTGKSTTVLNLAGVLALEKTKTVIVDLDLYSGVIAASLNLDTERNINTFALDLANNRFKAVEDYVYSYNEYIDVVSAPIDPRNAGGISSKAIAVIIGRLKFKYDVILIDTSHVLNRINLGIFDMSDSVLYVMTNDLMDIKNMKTMISIFKDMEFNKYKVILNEARYMNTSYTKKTIENLIMNSIECVIPKSFYVKQIEKYVYNGKIITLDKSFDRVLPIFKKML